MGFWVAISRRRIIGPVLFAETVGSEVYCWQVLFPFIGQLYLD
jgi:hypothetical protein